LSDVERANCFFQQDGATCHTSLDSLSLVYEAFTEERSVSKGLWPARSPYLFTCNFYLWGFLKDNVYDTNPHTLDEMKANIRSSIETTDNTVLRQVFLNIITRAQKCIAAQGGYFHHLL
jgi:hypothetical protein